MMQLLIPIDSSSLTTQVTGLGWGVASLVIPRIEAGRRPWLSLYAEHHILDYVLVVVGLLLC